MPSRGPCRRLRARHVGSTAGAWHRPCPTPVAAGPKVVVPIAEGREGCGCTIWDALCCTLSVQYDGLLPRSRKQEERLKRLSVVVVGHGNDMAVAYRLQPRERCVHVRQIAILPIIFRTAHRCDAPGPPLHSYLLSATNQKHVILVSTHLQRRSRYSSQSTLDSMS